MGCTVEYLSPELGIQLIASKYQSGVMNLFNYDPADFIISTKSDIFSLALSIMFIYRRGHVVISLFNNGKMSYNGLDAGTINKLRQTILVSVSLILVLLELPALFCLKFDLNKDFLGGSDCIP